jgi:hypothetical protein
MQLVSIFEPVDETGKTFIVMAVANVDFRCVNVAPEHRL